MGVLVRCNALNKCFHTEYNAKHYYCEEYKSFNEMSNSEIKAIENAISNEYANEEFKKWARKYHTKKEADELIKKHQKNFIRRQNGN